MVAEQVRERSAPAHREALGAGVAVLGHLTAFLFVGIADEECGLFAQHRFYLILHGIYVSSCGSRQVMSVTLLVLALLGVDHRCDVGQV